MRSLCVFTLFAASVLILGGCGGGGPETHPVLGTVTFDGDPVTNGEIVFRDAAGASKSYGGPITDGKYSFDSSPGNKNVEISAMREVPGQMDTESNPGESVPMMEQYIPEKYNTATTLTAEVSGSGETNFDLTSS